MINNHFGDRPAPIKDGKVLVSHEFEVPGGTIHNTLIVTLKGEEKTTS